MTKRTVLVTGGSSYIITLPKSWAKNLEKNYFDMLEFSDKLERDESNRLKGLIVDLKERSNGTIVIDPLSSQDKVQKIKEYNVKDIDTDDFLFRCLIGSYIGGCDLISIDTSEEGSPPFVRQTIRRFIKSTIGQEIVEESKEKIIIKDLLNPSEMPFDKTIKRMYRIARGMYEDAINLFLIKKNQDLALDILSRDEDLDRLYWLVCRRYNTILQSQITGEIDSTPIIKATNIFQVAKNIERIGDHSVRIVNNILNITVSLDNEFIESIKSASQVALEIFNRSIDSFFDHDLRASNSNIEAVKHFYKLYDELTEKASLQDGRNAISLGFIFESMRRIAEYAIDISENAINYIIEI